MISIHSKNNRGRINADYNQLWVFFFRLLIFPSWAKRRVWNGCRSPMMCKSSNSKVQVHLALHQVKSKSALLKTWPSILFWVTPIFLVWLPGYSTPSQSPSQVHFSIKIRLKSKSSPSPDLHIIAGHKMLMRWSLTFEERDCRHLNQKWNHIKM